MCFAAERERCRRELLGTSGNGLYSWRAIDHHPDALEIAVLAKTRCHRPQPEGSNNLPSIPHACSASRAVEHAMSSRLQ
jgi:hypothetical protein